MSEIDPTEPQHLANPSAPTAATPQGSGALVPGPAHLPPADPSRYQVVSEVARGGLGRILEVHDRRLGRQVAIKELLAGGGEAYRRFAREALITARLEHPAIIPVHDAGRWPSGDPFYAMKLVSGRSLHDTIARATTLEARLALVPNLVAVADAMAYAHSHRVLHRDLKPSNVLIGPFGETVVIDWGLAKDLRSPDEEPAAEAPEPLGDESLTQAGAVMGTPAYMPPEQARGQEVDERADVYALGAMLYHALAGRPPYQGPSGPAVLADVLAGPPVALATCQPGVPYDLAAIVHKAMAREPALRYPSAREFTEDLRRFQTGRLVSARQYSRPVLIGRWLRRYRLPVSIAGLALALLGIVGVASIGRIVAARRLAEQRANALLLAQARTALERDPTEALAWLRTYPESAEGWDEVRAIATEAESRGVARHVLGPGGFHGFTTDGQGWIGVRDGHIIEIHDLASGALRRRWPLLERIDRLQASPDGRTLAIANSGSFFALLDLASGHLRTLAAHRGPVNVYGFSPDGRWLASGGMDGVLLLWPTRGLADPRRLGSHDGPIHYLVFSRAGRTLLSRASESVTGRLWDVEGSSYQLIEVPAPIAARVNLAPDGAHVVVVQQNTLELWGLARGDRHRLGTHGGRINNFRFSPDGTLLGLDR
jgi:type II secretory pathway pseudopilin PulG